MLKATIKLYFDHNIPKSAAALSYHLTMTFFPLLICLYALFGQNYLTALRVFGFVKQFLTEHAANVYIQDMADLIAVRKGLTGLTFYPLYVLDVSTLKWE